MLPLLRRPFAFWLPTFGLLFLLWAWVDSCRYHTFFSQGEVSTHGGYRDITVHHSYGALTVFYQRVSGTTLTTFPSGHVFTRTRLDHFARIAPAPSFKSKTEESTYYQDDRPHQRLDINLLLPHWLLILLYLALWSLAFYCRHRRTKRSLTKHPSPAQPQTD
jgi:hypothetical protein